MASSNQPSQVDAPLTHHVQTSCTTLNLVAKCPTSTWGLINSHVSQMDPTMYIEESI